MRYIGLTNDFKKRKNEHFNDLKSNKHHNYLLQSDYDKLGRKTFKMSLIENDIPTLDDANKLEMKWIAHFGLNNTYNLTKGGNSTSNSLTVSCTWNGIEYESIKEAARANEVTYASMSSRIMRGYTCDEDMSDMRVSCTWNGIEYESIRGAARANNISHGGMQQRLKKGYTCDDDVPDEIDHFKKTCTWNGIEYDSITEAARSSGISHGAMRYRLKQGYTSDSDLQFPNGS
jgi:hypothetical protein